MKSFSVPGLLVVTLSLMIMPAAAHHSAAMFDMQREITLQGTITAFEWNNPHVYIEIDVLDDQGETASWTIEGSSTSLLRRVGWSSDSLATGQRVTVVVNPARNPNRRLVRGVSVEKAGGPLLPIPNLRNIQTLTPAPAQTFVATDLSGTWMPDAASPRSRLPDSWPLTAKGQATLQGYDESLNPLGDCVPLASPLLMLSAGTVKSIEMSEESLVIRAGDAVRRVHMDVDSHDGARFTVQGHSIGRWTDGVLVIDTTHFSDHLFGYGRGLASGARKHLIERLELSQDGTRLHYSFQVRDPEYLTGTVTGTLEFEYRPDLPNAAEECDREAARRYLQD